MSTTVSERGWNIRYGVRTVTYEIDGPLCGVECVARQHNDMCMRGYPEAIAILEQAEDGRHKRCEACVKAFGIDGDKEIPTHE